MIIEDYLYPKINELLNILVANSSEFEIKHINKLRNCFYAK